MTTASAQRILDLWPTLTPEKQAELIETAERMAQAADEPIAFTPEDLAGIERGRADFKHGRTLTVDEFETRSRSILEGLRREPKTT